MNSLIHTDFKKLAVILLPVRLRHSVLSAFMSVTMLPFLFIKRALKEFADQKAEELKITGQTCKLQKLLNDTFDNEQRRILVIDSSEIDLPMVYVFPRDADNVLFVSSKDNPVLIQARNNNTAVPTDFYVIVPKKLGLFDNVRLKALVNTYKLAAKRWLIKEQ